MPSALLRACARNGCTNLSERGLCDACRRQRQRIYDDHRGSASSRGYGRRWARYRAWFLGKWPLCGNRPSGAPETADSRCLAEGLLTPATVVDHIVPATGPGDPSFFRPAAHQALCEACHNAKRQRESMTSYG